ncbi:MAG: glutamate-1-semialdehyde 2,1-aminomutase [Anaerolineales bacterium]|nr:glutamate-1-semialdehyde 2,1-aminomutase [Anaerolineales bacterium]
MRHLERTQALFAQATQYLAGGVSSDARRSVKAVPLYVDHAAGARLWDVDEHEYLDYVLGQGPLILGHSHPAILASVKAQLDRGQVYSAQHALEVEVAAAVCRVVPCAQRLRFNSVGSEAVHAAWRLARAYTGREIILKFEGHYHGWFDSALYSVAPGLAAAGPEAAPVAVPGTRGQARSTAGDLVIAPWNNLDALEHILSQHKGNIAAICMEPVLCNSGCIAPLPGYLAGVQALCRRHGCLLIFDEVITGFRLALGGAQEYLGVTPDLAVFGKAIAGGFPLSCLAGSAEVMDLISRGEVGHAGTFNSNPVVMAAAAATLRHLESNAATLYPRLTTLGQRLMAGIRQAAQAAGVPLLVEGPGPVFNCYFTDQPAVTTYRDYARCDLSTMARLQQALLDRGVNMVGRGLWFLSTAHTEADIDQTVLAVADALTHPLPAA